MKQWIVLFGGLILVYILVSQPQTGPVLTAAGTQATGLTKALQGR